MPMPTANYELVSKVDLSGLDFDLLKEGCDTSFSSASDLVSMAQKFKDDARNTENWRTI